MQTFYLSRNQHGYFRFRFPDLVTGKLGKAKSTHTKNRQQATLIEDEWCRNGVPAGRSRGLFLLLILVWIWLLLWKKLNRTEQLLPSTERRCATQTRSREQLCFLHLSILKSLKVIRGSFNVIFPLFVYLWGLQRRAIRIWQAYVAHHVLKLKNYATVISESMFAVK